MIILNEKADIFIFPDNNISILLDGKAIEISGEDTVTVAKLFKEIHNKRDVMGISNLFDNKKISDDVMESIDAFKELKVIVDVDENYTSEGSYLVKPFFVFPLYNMWCFRCREKLYCFAASNRDIAEQKMRDILLGCADEEDLNLFLRIIRQEVECLPGRFCLPYDDTMFDSCDEESIFVFNLRSRKAYSIKNSFSEKKTDFWKELKKRAVGETRIVPMLKKAREDNSPFKRSKHACYASHRPTSFGDIKVDLQMGVDENIDIAKGKAIMEAIERYCGRKLIRDGLTIKPMKLINPDDIIDPKRLWSYIDTQFSRGWLNDLSPSIHDDVIPWVKVKNFLDGKNKMVPLSYVSYAVEISEDNYPVNFRTTSSGMAAHTSLEEAVKKGILEIIERDAILIYWHNKIIPKQISPSGMDRVNILANKLIEVGYELYLVDLTLDTVPVVMAIAYRKNGEFPFSSGAAAAESKESAINKAIDELEFEVWSKIKYARDNRRRKKAVSLETIKDPADHEALYWKPGMTRYLKFLLQGGIHEIDKEELSRETDVFSSICSKGYQPFYLDMTAKEVENLNLGIKVVRTIIPGFVPITFGYGHEPLNMERIYNIPVELGLRKQKITEAELINDYMPHFFP